MVQGGFEPTTLGLEGKRHTTELKFCLKNLGQNWWSVFQQNLDNLCFLNKNKYWTIELKWINFAVTRSKPSANVIVHAFLR